VGEFNSWRLETAGSGWEALERIQSGAAPDLLLLDIPRGDGDILHALRWLRRIRPELPVIVLGHPEDISREKEARRLGAHDFLIRPLGEQQLESAIRAQLCPPVDGIAFTSEDIEKLSDDSFFLAACPAMQKLRAQAELLGQADVPVFIVGEPGSGKETTARLIHKLSVRSGFKFLRVDCAALPPDLLEKELFGYAAGPLSNNGGNVAGKVEICARGTIFLDEISEMPPRLQEQLFRVMQEKQFTKPGTTRPVDVDVRILASSDNSPERLPAEERLREDLYFRLSAFTVHVPSLRQRRDEIPLLLQHFMHKLARHYGLPPREFSSAAIDACKRHSWPGNVAELESFVKRYLMIGDDDSHLTGLITSPATKTLPTAAPKNGGTQHPGEHVPGNGKSLKSLIRDVKSEAERNAIAAALERTGWNRKAAARLLKVSYRTMLYKIEQYQMSASDPLNVPFVTAAEVKGNIYQTKGNGKALD
jgi:DNA-binding NtrC family response regulator